MKKIICLLLLFCGVNFSQAHDLNYEKVIPHQWKIEKENKTIDGSFYMLKDGKVFIETTEQKIVSFPLQSLSKADLKFAVEKENKILALNREIIANQNVVLKKPTIFDAKFLIVAILFLLFGIFLLQLRRKEQFKYLLSVFILGLSFALYSFTVKSLQSTNPTTIDAAFAPFVPNVHTSYDANYFYVESKGIPTTHGMMVGISNNGWQRQVPIPQCYIGTNAWQIPLNPTMAATPIPVDSVHFTRGAIAIAVNGVPIFNEHTNTGADALTAGQLDSYGGHCGRADDYHYHIAPLHLYAYTQATLPIAYALDGFAVYGSVEPDGTTMQTLDANHGHSYGGTYHYHGTTTYPYMIGNMAGNVTEDNTHQLIPQAAAHPVRAGQNPLGGALITACNPNTTGNGYTMIYTYQSNTDSVVYSWDALGNYTFKYYTAGNLDSSETKHGFVQCTVPATPNGINELQTNENGLTIYPNPTNSVISIRLSVGSIKIIEVMNLQGEKMELPVTSLNSDYCKLITENLPTGIYFIKVIDNKGVSSVSKFVKE